MNNITQKTIDLYYIRLADALITSNKRLSMKYINTLLNINKVDEETLYTKDAIHFNNGRWRSNIKEIDDIIVHALNFKLAADK